MTQLDADPTLALPRILCLHGGGVNADVFRLQCRGIAAKLRPYFRLVFVDGPFICPPHEAIVSVYGDHGPFRRWLRWLPQHPEVDAETATSEIQYQIRLATEDDDALGATGPFVGLLGFSQGAKVSASLLWTEQALRARGVEPEHGFQFAVLMAGRGPVVTLDERAPKIKHVADASEGSTSFTDWPGAAPNETAQVVRTPTIHVHGTRDPGLEHHQRLLREYCAPETTKLVVWEGGHRLPIKSQDVEAVTSEIIALAKELGIINEGH